VRGTLADVRGTLEEVRGTLDQVRGTLDQVRGTLDQVRGTLDQVRRALDQVRREPYQVRGTPDQVRTSSATAIGGKPEGCRDQRRRTVIFRPACSASWMEQRATSQRAGKGGAEGRASKSEPREERIGMAPAPDFDLDRPAVHSARRRPTDAQIDAAAAYAELPVDEAAAVDLWRKRRGRLG
jgi:hypothetical protein